MSFWGGVARGFQDSEAKKERDTDRAERESARLDATQYRDKMDAYNQSRDSLLDKRHNDATAAETDRYNATTKLNAANRAEDISYRAGRDKVGDKADQKTWEMTVEKWDATKDSVEQAQDNADRIFDQSILAFKATTKQYTAQSLRADSQEARAVAAAIYQKERDGAGDKIAKANMDRRIAEWDTSVEQWNKQFGLQENADARAAEQVETDRAVTLLAAMPAGMATALAGGSSKGAGDTSMTQAAMQTGSAEFKAQMADLGEDEQSSEFFEAASKSPGAQATIMSFMEAQAKEGNPVELRDMPKYFKYLGSAPGTGEKEAKEFMETMIAGDANLTDKDTFIKGLTAMKNFRATKEMFVQTNAPTSIGDQGKQLELWETAVTMDAYRGVGSLPDAQQKDVRRALGMLERKENRQEGLDRLAALGYGRATAEKQNMMDHPIISTYYSQEAPAAVVAEQPAAAATVAAQPAAAATEAPAGQTFDDWTAVEVARADGFSGVANVGGVSYTISPLEIEEPADTTINDGVPTAAMTAAALSDPADIGDDSGFLGTGKTERPSLPKNTAIDAMFGDVFDSKIGVEENSPDWDRTTTPVEGITIEEGIPGIEKAVDNFEVAPEGATRAAELRESQGVQMVIQELEDMGIEWPTNREELGFFRDDLVSLVSDYDVEIPDEIMSKIIDRAKEQSGVGIIPQGDLDRIMRAKEAEDKDTLSNLMNKYGVGPVTEAMGVGN